MKKVFSWIIKAALAGLAALVLLCLWSSFYYNVPVHYTNPSGATEYVWQSDKFFRKGTEGFAFGRTNNEGFNNILDYEEGDSVDILLMGSSHIEAMNVKPEENTAAVLNRIYAGEKYCYNIGTSGHTLAYCLKHLPAALDTYRPGGYVVIETRTLSFSEDELRQVVEGEVPDIPSHTGGIVEALQKLPYLRLMYTKYLSGDEGGDDAASGPSPTTEQDLTVKAGLLNDALSSAGEDCREKGVTGIIVYDPVVRANSEGKGYTDTLEEELEMFSAACRDAGLIFIDLTESYLDGYDNEHKLPYGFYNTEPGMGHMNAWGHRLFAQAVYETIEQKEGAA